MRRSARSATRCSNALDSDTNLVDVRSPQEFSGELIAMAGYEQEGAQRSGHIPEPLGALGPGRERDGTFKSADELRELYQGKGVIEDGEPIIAYCRIGERSAHTWFVLHELLGEGQRQELRRVLDRVGEPRERPDREGRVIG